MKRYYYIVLFLLISLRGYSQDTIHWNADTIKIYNDYLVPEQSLLIIHPGVFVEFQGYYSIYIDGRVEAIGTENDTVIFTISDTTGYMNEWTTNGGWHGIRFNERNLNDTSFFAYCKFQYAKAGTAKHENVPDNCGGAISAESYSNLYITNSLFRYNFAGFYGAGIFSSDLISLFVKSNSFNHNNAKYKGGGIYAMSTQSHIESNFFYKNKAFRQDTLDIGYLYFQGTGSAVFHQNEPNEPPFIGFNKMFNNIGVSGTLYESTKNGLICNNIICNNNDCGLFDGYGWWSNKIIVNNTIVNNYDYYTSGENGGGVWSVSRNHTFMNNIIYGNRTKNYFTQISDPEIQVSYSCIQDGYAGETNISDYPQFANPTEGAGIEYDGLAADWTLLNTSPCVNTGTPDTAGLNLSEIDIAGNPRIYGGRIDMGAYENQYVHIKENNSLLGSKIKLYPNPGSNKIYIDYIDIPPEMEGAHIEIVDGQGKVMLHQQIRFSPAVLSPYKLQAGIYFYRIYTHNKVVKSGKWVKR